MKVRVLYFGVVRERVARKSGEDIALADDASLRGLMSLLCGSYPALAGMRGHLRLAVNEDFAGDDRILADGDVVALIPPVAGGSGRYCRLTDQPLSVDEVLASVAGPGQGGTVVFIGYVRGNTGDKIVAELEYEAYGSMTTRVLDDILDRCEAEPGVRVSIAHRTGRLAVGEIVVVIAASAPHRAEAFHAARACAELLKAEAPIWKKEIGPDGEVWVGAPDVVAIDEPLTG